MQDFRSRTRQALQEAGESETYKLVTQFLKVRDPLLYWPAPAHSAHLASSPGSGQSAALTLKGLSGAVNMINATLSITTTNYFQNLRLLSIYLNIAPFISVLSIPTHQFSSSKFPFHLALQYLLTFNFLEIEPNSAATVSIIAQIQNHSTRLTGGGGALEVHEKMEVI